MALLIPNKLSNLQIDADKDWQTKGVTNIKQVAAAMAKGDLVVRGDTVLARLQPGSIGLVLTSAGALHIPAWAPGGSALNMYFPYPIELYNAEAIVAIAQAIAKGALITSSHVQNYLDDVANMIKRLDVAPTLSSAQAIATVDQTASKAPVIGREGGVQMLVDGAIKEDTPAQVDDTANARSVGANDMVLLPALPVVNDAYYIGFLYPFNRVWLNIGTAGVGNWTLTEEYWNGAWVALAGVVDLTNQFMAGGLKSSTFTKPGDWALLNILGYNLYWMRYRVSNFVNIVTQPLGTQAWCEILS